MNMIFQIVAVLWWAMLAVYITHVAVKYFQEARKVANLNEDTGKGDLPDPICSCPACRASLRESEQTNWQRLTHDNPITNLFLAEKPCPLSTQDPGVRVMPIPPIDQQNPVDKTIVHVFFVVPYALDEDLLRHGLDDLIRNHWQKLGARVARRPDGLLEYRIPKDLGGSDNDYKLFNWSSARHSHGVRDVLSLALPLDSSSSGGGVQLQAADGGWDRSMTVLAGPRDMWPRQQEDAPADMPLLTVHLSHFADRTAVVGICFPHVLADQMGLGNVVRAWLGVMGGRAPPPLLEHPAAFWPGEGYAKGEYSPRRCSGEEMTRGEAQRRTEDSGDLKAWTAGSIGSIPAWKALQRRVTGTPQLFGWRGRVQFVGNILREVLLSPTERDGVILLPLRLVSCMRTRMNAEIKRKYGPDAPKISESDVVSAILCKLGNMHRPGSNRPVSLSSVINLRGRIPTLDDNDEGSYVHNALVYAFARVGRSDLAGTRLAEVAFRQRLALLEVTRPWRVDANLREINGNFAAGNKSPMLGDMGDRPYIVSNWSAAWRGVDFAAAAEEGVGAEGKGRLLVLGRAQRRETPMRFISMVMSKTDDGYWATFSATPRNMQLVGAYLERDPFLECLM